MKKLAFLLLAISIAGLIWRNFNASPVKSYKLSIGSKVPKADVKGDDSFEAMKEYAKVQGYNWSYVVDQNSVLADAFGATRTPECFLFNKDQSLVYHGAIDDNPSFAALVIRSHLKKAINEMLDGKEVAVKTSRSVGCTIYKKG